MARDIVRINDGFVTAWFSNDEPVPAGCVEVPEGLMAKWRGGEITDGVQLARAALSGEAGGATAAKPAKAAPKGQK